MVGAARGREDEAGDRGANKPTVCGVGRAEGSVRSVNGLKQARGAKRSVAVDQKLEATLKQNGGAPLLLTKTSELAGDGETGAGIESH